MIKVFFAGIAGCNKSDFLKDFKKLCSRRGKKCQVISLGEIIFQLASEAGFHLKEEKWLNLPRTTIRSLLSRAFERIEKIIDLSQDVVIISTHASYWWKNGPEHAFDISSLSNLDPDLFITFIKEPNLIKQNIENDPRWGKNFISLEEILIWTELEIYTVELLATLLKKKHYLLHYDHQPETLYRLIFQPYLPKVYLSYPMTFVKPNDFKVIDKFIKSLKKVAIVFDPIKGEKGKAGLEGIFANHIVKRDYRLIDQSDIIIIYYFKLVASPGVENEKTYAHQTNKFVWVIYNRKTRSPFTYYYSDRFFNNTQEVLKELKNWPKFTK